MQLAAQEPDVMQMLLDSRSATAWGALNRGAVSFAENLFRWILDRDASRPDDIAGLGTALSRQGKTAEALELLRNGGATPQSA